MEKVFLAKIFLLLKLVMALKKFFTPLLFIGNEWITSPVLMKFVEDYCFSYVNNLRIFNVNARTLFNSVSIYIMPMVNPDGVNLVTGKISPSSSAYISAQNIASMYPSVPFTSGWKANIRGVDLKNYQPICKVL